MNRYHWLILLAILTSFTGLFNQVFMADSALYACIAKSFVQSGDYLNIYVNGQDWLDKPHFSFWMEAVSMEVFGLNAFAFKLPSFLFFLLGLVYIYLLSIKLYSKEVGLLAVLIFATALHIMLSNNDIKTDTILTGLVIACTYHLYELTHSSRWRDILLSALFMAAAIMTKGVFVIIIFVSAVAGYLALKGSLKNLLHYKWLMVLLLVALFITPELYALYMQFDMHPEKLVFGRQNVSGLEFFFWGSQFGRFSGSGPVTTGAAMQPLYYLHTFLWAFAPWAFIAYAAWFGKVRSLFKEDRQQEYMTLFGFTVMFIVFSLSGSQLAHWTNIIFPFMAIMTANFIVNGLELGAHRKIFNISLFVFAALIPVLMLIIAVVFINKFQVLMPILCIIASASFVYMIYGRENWRNVLSGAVVGICCLMLFMNTCFYPALHKYQAGSEAAIFVRDNYEPQVKLAYVPNWLFEFYSDRNAQRLDGVEGLSEILIDGESTLVFADRDLLQILDKEQFTYEEVRQFDNFRTSMITADFFNHKSRESVLEKMYLLEVKAAINHPNAQ